jgi:hypothetical protein
LHVSLVFSQPKHISKQLTENISVVTTIRPNFPNYVSVTFYCQGDKVLYTATLAPPQPNIKTFFRTKCDHTMLVIGGLNLTVDPSSGYSYMSLSAMVGNQGIRENIASWSASQ